MYFFETDCEGYEDVPERITTVQKFGMIYNITKMAFFSASMFLRESAKFENFSIFQDGQRFASSEQLFKHICANVHHSYYVRTKPMLIGRACAARAQSAARF